MTFSARSRPNTPVRDSKVQARKLARRLAGTLALAGLPLVSTGCGSMSDDSSNVLDYLNLRNGFLDPSQVGRFDKAKPWGKVKPVKWPILDQLDVIDEPVDEWASATEPTSADLIPDVKEYVLSTGDTINIGIFEFITPQTEFVQQRKINELGYINLQNLGPVLVSGLTPTQLEQKIIQMVVEAKLLPPPGPGQPGPQVNVTVSDSRARVFSVLGGAARAGTYNVLSSDFRLLDALALFGDVPAQPGQDYLYIIRQIPYTQNNAASAPAATPAGPAAQNPAPKAAGNPLQALENVENATPSDTTTKPSSATPTSEPSKAPATSPGTDATPALKLIRPLPTAVVMSGGSSGNQLAAADLDAALNAPPATPATPATAATTASATTAPVMTAEPAGTTRPAGDTKALEGALNTTPSDTTTRFVFIDGRWVPIQVKVGTSGATLPGIGVTSASTTPGQNVPEVPGSTSAENLVQQRIIRIPMAALRQGVSRYNIVIRPGDVLNIPTPPVGEFYMMGHVSRPGVYSLTGRKITLKQAVAAAGNLDSVAVPRRCDLIRRVGKDQEAIVQVNLQKIFDGEQPDIFLKAEDVVNVGTDALAPFLLVTRNAYRASYGWGFVYDRNLYTGNNGNGG